MTADAITGKLSDAAKSILERYLWELRVSLQGCRSVNAAEVEADVKQHIDQELVDAPAPVSPDQLDVVLKKLGSPRQWVPEEELAWWRRAILKLRTGPHDIRLASATIGLFLLGLVFVPVTWPFILGSFLLARAVIALMADKEEELGWQRWLVYPPLVLLYVPFAFVLCFWPAIVAPLAVELTDRRSGGPLNPFNGQPWSLLPDVSFPIAAAIAALSAWWIILLIVCLIWPQLKKQVFRPFAKRASRIGTAVVLLICLVVFAISGSVLSRMATLKYQLPAASPAVSPDRSHMSTATR